MIRPMMKYVVIWTSCDNDLLGRVLKLQKRVAILIINYSVYTLRKVQCHLFLGT
jgi:hypothetical protein